MLGTYNLCDLFFFFLSDCNIWQCFLLFVVNLFAAALFVLDECFSYVTSLIKWCIPFAHTLIKLENNIAFFILFLFYSLFSLLHDTLRHEIICRIDESIRTISQPVWYWWVASHKSFVHKWMIKLIYFWWNWYLNNFNLFGGFSVCWEKVDW